MNENEWKNSGSDCCSPFTSFLLSWFCPCIMYGRTAHRLHKDPTLSDFSCCNLDCCAYACLYSGCCHGILLMMQRGEVRSKYHLKGDGCTDCLCGFCCQPCTQVQQNKEVEDWESQRSQTTSQQPGKVETMNYITPQPVPHHDSYPNTSPPPQGHYAPQPGYQPQQGFAPQNGQPGPQY